MIQHSMLIYNAETQREAILERLRTGPAKAAELARLASQYNARIYELRRQGHHIESQGGYFVVEE